MVAGKGKDDHEDDEAGQKNVAAHHPGVRGPLFIPAHDPVWLLPATFGRTFPLRRANPAQGLPDNLAHVRKVLLAFGNANTNGNEDST